MADTFERDRKAIDTMLHPRSIAVLGATARMQYGGRFLKALLDSKYPGRIYPVNPKYEELMGVKCYPSVASLPEVPDLAGVIVPFQEVVPVLEECARKGVPSAVIITAGFAEREEADRKVAQVQLHELATKTGPRLCGPNCLGLVNVKDTVWSFSGHYSTLQGIPSGPLALVAQSGATAFGPLAARAADLGVGLKYIISTGNEADLEAMDFVRYALDDPEVKAVLTSIEGFKDGAKLRKVAALALQRGKPIVILKLGRSEAGSRAARSHTAAMTGSDVVQDAFFKQMGMIRVEDWDELLEVGSLLAKCPPPENDGVGVVSHSGGIGGILVDKCGYMGLQVPLPSQKTKEGIDGILKGFGSARNPMDVTGYATSEEFPKILDFMIKDEGFGIIIVGSSGGDSQAQQIIAAASSTTKPVVMLWTGNLGAEDGLKLLKGSQVPVFYLPDKVVRGVRKLVDYHRTRRAWLAERQDAKASESVPQARAA
ncbi:MAG: CoA-binding protein [Chloroflexota bacterium]|nr:CoA-binding protein [Chloroflexota bacterium]